MAKDIATLRAEINADLDDKASVLGETTPLSPAEQNTVSHGVDAKNETWNENLPTRPH